MRNYLKIFLLILPTIYCQGQIKKNEIPVERQAQLKLLVDLIKKDNVSGLADLVVYPLKRPNPVPDIANKQEFIKYYPTLLDQDFKKKMVITKFDSTNTIDTYIGFGLFSGDIWLDDEGKIMTINYSSPDEIRLIESLKRETENKIHTSVKPWKMNISVCETDKFLVRVDVMQDDDLRYVAWSKPKYISDKPDIILFKGTQEFQGTIGGVTYTFKNGEYFYQIDKKNIGETNEEVGLFLRIYKNQNDLEEDKDLVSYKCKEVK